MLFRSIGGAAVETKLNPVDVRPSLYSLLASIGGLRIFSTLLRSGSTESEDLRGWAKVGTERIPVERAEVFEDMVRLQVDALVHEADLHATGRSAVPRRELRGGHPDVFGRLDAFALGKGSAQATQSVPACTSYSRTGWAEVRRFALPLLRVSLRDGFAGTAC